MNIRIPAAALAAVSAVCVLTPAEAEAGVLLLHRI